MNHKLNNIKRIYNLEILVTQLCNMRCDYCFELEDITNDSNKKQNHIDYIINCVESLLTFDYFSTQYDEICINFWGGEPTLAKKEINYIIDKFISNDKISFFMYTNGTNPEYLIQLYKKLSNRIRFQISYDGYLTSRKGMNRLPNFEIIQDSFKLLKSQDVPFSVKSTITPLDLVFSINGLWDHFYRLYRDNNNVLFNITIEYTQLWSNVVTKEYLESLENELIGLTKKELLFKKRYNHHLCSFFHEPKGLKNCSAGVNIGCFDLTGNFLYCHGALYSPDHIKKKLLISEKSIKVDKFLENFKKSHEKYIKMFKEVHKYQEKCQECVATDCHRCPVVNLERNSNGQNDLKGSDLHNPTGDICDIYELIGKFNRSLYLK